MIMKTEDLIKALQEKKGADLFIDCGQGDKFQVIDFKVNENNNSIDLMIHRGSVRWIEMDGKHPIKLTTDGTRTD